MPFADFDINKFDSAETAVIDTATPINGLGSLNVKGTENASAGYVSVTLNSGQTRGFSKGKIETIFRRDSVDAASIQRGTGFIFVISSQSPWLTGQSFYWAGLNNTGTGGYQWRVYRFTNGITAGFTDGTTTELGSSVTNVPLVTQERAIAVEWNDAPEFGGTQIIFRAAPDDQIANLVDVITLVDPTGTALSTTLSEGFLTIDQSGSASFPEEMTIDDTSFFQLVAV